MNEFDPRDYLSEPERRRWDAAIETGGDTFENFLAPDCGADGFSRTYYCDDCNVEHTYHFGLCYDVFEGVPYAVEWTCDEDGDWDYQGLCPLSEFDEAGYFAAALDGE